MKANAAVHAIFNVTRGKLFVSVGQRWNPIPLLSCLLKNISACKYLYTQNAGATFQPTCLSWLPGKSLVTTCDVNYPICILSGKKEFLL